MKGAIHLGEGLIMVLIAVGLRELVWEPLLAPTLNQYHWLNPIMGKFLALIPIVLMWWLIRRKVYAWLRGKGWY